MAAKRFFGAVSFALLLLTLAGVPGCGKRLASVSGKVTYKNKPVTSGNVVFVGADGQPSPPAPIQPDGTYTATKVTPGPAKVVVDNPPPLNHGHGQHVPKEMANDPEIREAAKQTKSYVPTPPKYGDAKQSDLSADLKPGSNNFDIQLK
jgi:hypothetical protein